MRVAGVCLAPDVAPSFRIRSCVGMLNRGVLFGPSALKFLLPNPKSRIAGTKTMKGVHDWPWGTDLNLSVPRAASSYDTQRSM